uniref:Major sperm protein n=1 Tax=Parastrongyloides trichosuri TaxID=131310 RepID=A0A0N4Z293_PARTI
MIRNKINLTFEGDSHKIIDILKNNVVNNPAFKKLDNNYKNIIFNNDWYLEDTLISRQYDLDIAQAVVLQALKWRNNLNIKHISLLEFKSLIESEIMYFHGHDIDKNEIFWINLKHFNNHMESTIKKLVIYLIEHYYFLTKGKPIVMIINMNQTSLHNLNMDFFKFLFNSFKYYYPNYLNSIYLLECSPKIQPLWKVIKSWLDDYLANNFFILPNEELEKYIPLKYIPKYIGGEDTYKVNMEDIAKYTSSNDYQNDSGYYEAPTLEQQQPQLDTSFIRKSVSFGRDDDEDVRRVSPLTMSSDGNNIMVSSTTDSIENGKHNSRLVRRNSKGQLPPSVPPRSNSQRRNNHIPQHLKPLVEEKLNTPPEGWFLSDIVHMCPSSDICLKSVDTESDYVEIIVLKNVTNKNVFYKIRITSPEKFRVRPSTGVLKPNSQEVIRLYLQNEYKSTVFKDRFLLMALPVEDNAKFENFSKIWQETSDENKIERKLICKLDDTNVISPSSVLKKNSTVGIMKEEGNDTLSTLKLRQNIIILALSLMIILQIIIISKLINLSSFINDQMITGEKCQSNDGSTFRNEEL